MKITAGNASEFFGALNGLESRFDDAFVRMEKLADLQNKAMFGRTYKREKYGYHSWLVEAEGFCIKGFVETGAMGCYQDHWCEHWISFEDFFDGFDGWKNAIETQTKRAEQDVEDYEAKKRKRKLAAKRIQLEKLKKELAEAGCETC